MVVDRIEDIEFDEAEVDRLFQALSDRTRRDIMGKVSEEEQSISSLARQYDVSFAAIQKHVTVLERAELVTKRSLGREKLVCSNPETIRRAGQLLARYEHLWRRRSHSIERLLKEDPKGTPNGNHQLEN